MKISKTAVHQSLACIPPVFIQFLIGVGWGWTSPTLHKLKNGHEVDLVITPDQASWLGSISELGRILGPIVSPLLIDNIGRKATLSLVGILYVVVWLLVIFFRDFYILLATRILFGIGNGVNDVVATVYTTEICTPVFRGISGSAIVVSFFVGHIFESFISTYLSYTNVAIVNMVMAIGAIGSLYFGIETTYFLTMKGKHEKAKKNLLWLNPGQHDVEAEIEKIRKNVAEEKEKRRSYKSLFMEKNNSKAILVVAFYGLMWSGVGYHTVLPFSSFIFAPSEWFTSNEFTIMFSASQFVTSIVACFVIERINRRSLFIYSFFVITIGNICVSVLLYLHSKNYDIKYYPWIIFSTVSLEMVAYALMLPAAYIVASEILPLSVRAIGGSISVTCQSAASFATAVFFWPLTENYGMESNFVIYTVVCVVTLIFVYAVMPETRGKALHDMYQKRVDIDTTVLEMHSVM